MQNCIKNQVNCTTGCGKQLSVSREQFPEDQGSHPSHKYEYLTRQKQQRLHQRQPFKSFDVFNYFLTCLITIPSSYLYFPRTNCCYLTQQSSFSSPSIIRSTSLKNSAGFITWGIYRSQKPSAEAIGMCYRNHNVAG